MKKDWTKPKLDILNVSMTMKFHDDWPPGDGDGDGGWDDCWPWGDDS